jgi:uncharacterized protein (DUF736 family)
MRRSPGNVRGAEAIPKLHFVVEKTMIIGRFEKHENGFLGSIETLGWRLDPVRLLPLDKGADYTIHGPDDCELGAAWRKAGDYGDYLSIRLDCPSLAAPVNAVMALKADQEGFYRLRWNRRTEKHDARRVGAID